MPRQARIILANTPHHIVQRGHNRQSVFVKAADHQYYLNTLREWKEALKVKIYAYCLMTNHVHLIVDPGDEEVNLGKLMKRLAGRQTRYFNYLKKRTGSLWEGRYKSSPIETDTYLLACCRYVELNPVRAGMVQFPEDYRWSSYRQKVDIEHAKWIDDDPAFLGLSVDAWKRMRQYRQYVNEQIPEAEKQLICDALQRGQLTGTSHFIDAVEKRCGIRVARRPQGRPKKLEAENEEHVGK